MASYKLVFKASVAKDLGGIPKKDLTRILQRIDALQNDPRPVGCEKLTGQEQYRVRQGKYRILYQIEDNRLVVCVVKVAHRKHAYTRR